MPAAAREPARCRLYLTAPATLPDDFARSLEAALAVADVACLRLAPAPEAVPLIAEAQARGAAVLLDGRPDLVAGLGADGVHLADPAAYDAARRLLGEKASIGVWCDASRHAAMEAADAGADYVGFAPDLDLVGWWAEIMVVPQVVELGDDLERAAEFAAAGADFIAPSEAIWRHGDGVAARLQRMMALLA